MVKSKLSSRNACVVLRQLNPIHENGPYSFLSLLDKNVVGFSDGTIMVFPNKLGSCNCHSRIVTCLSMVTFI